ncbi:PadR family transcriptional regulator [Apilactobacillus sp. TMW 2.2459]|uniref:PadR family transcriptional regulator n=1 Tax=Apilactobacillus xinyiensis TaxID=2841032 RepID=UPI00200BC44F|nr:PadR family transcriptional regulator [Apilactobacillus xinyiensis]MCL0312089.1 PadR family transcriptional regulator [Apilactobacillus xinyiensis]MCL0318639.1 PadR family transcriptional regulator [Apilactobacillus xinyiensis]
MAVQISSRLLDGSVLGLLSVKDYYGYALTQEVQKYIAVSESTMYPVLRRLKSNGLVTTYDEPYQGRNRRYYRITNLGLNSLKSIDVEWKQFKNAVDTMLKGDRHE